MYYWFIFHKDQLLLENNNIPFGENPPIESSLGGTVHELPTLNNIPCRAFHLKEPFKCQTDDGALSTIGLRASYDILSLDLYLMAGKAEEILNWDESVKFCSRCGAPMKLHTPISKKCTACEREVWPTISTAIIVRITKGDEILLVRAKNFRGTFYGLVAGFLETGETLEECVQREVLEETGLHIRNIQYFGSQPWPYPSGLMVGFTAEYESGTLKLQDEELSSGAFFHRNNLPEIPHKLSMARMLIDDWLKTFGGKRQNS